MTDAVIFKNNASSRLGINVAAASITITLEPGTGTRFPVPGVDEFFPVIVNDRRTDQFEIMYCTQRINDILTVDRAQEGTTAQDWLLGASVWSTATAGVFTTYFNYSFSKDEANARFVNTTGDVMTGALTLSGAPTIDLHAVTKLYVDDLVATVTSLTEAPNDGNAYARRNLAWIQTVTLSGYNIDAIALDVRFDNDELDISTLQTQMLLRITDAPSDGSEYVRKNGAWSILGAALTDAPSDGTVYGRRNAVWTAAVPLAGGTMTGLLLLSADPAAPLGAVTKQYADLRALINSPTFTGIPAAPTAGAGTNTTQIATTAFVTAADNLKANLAGPTFTGIPAAPTAGAGTNTTQIATTAFVTAADNLKADLASPTFTGDPKAPTAGTSDNDTSIANTAMVQAAIAAKALRYDAVQALAAAPRAIARANSGLVITPQGRGTLNGSIPVTVADMVSATALAYTAFGGELVPIWSVTDTEFKVPVLGTLFQTLDSNAAHTNYQQAGKNYDIFAFLNVGVLTIGNGPAWNAGAVAGSDTARGTGAGSTELELWHGLRVNKNALTMRIDATAGTVAVAAREATFIFTIRATADGVTEDSKAKRFLSNAYRPNRALRPMQALEATDTWTYTNGTNRQVNANTANQLDFVRSVDEDMVWAMATAMASNSSAVQARTMIGLDSTTVKAADSLSLATNVISGGLHTMSAEYAGLPGLGRHFLAWLESCTVVGTTTWYGDAGTPLVIQNGIIGGVFG